MVISESLEKTDADALKAGDIDTIDWQEASSKRLSDYEIIIIDTRISRAEAFRDLVFSRIRKEVETLLAAEGVVFVLLGRSLAQQSDDRKTIESNYSFLPNVVLYTTNLLDSESRIGRRLGFGLPYEEHKIVQRHVVLDFLHDRIENVPITETHNPLHIELRQVAVRP